MICIKNQFEKKHTIKAYLLFERPVFIFIITFFMFVFYDKSVFFFVDIITRTRKPLRT